MMRGTSKLNSSRRITKQQNKQTANWAINVGKFKKGHKFQMDQLLQS
jgi:hypothetical protein